MNTRREFIQYAGATFALATLPGCSDAATALPFGSSEAAQTGGAFPDNLRADGRLIDPANPNYLASRTVFNPRVDVRPALIAYCNSDREVSAAVKWARANGHRVAVRSGGHSYEGYSMNQDLVIDISNIKGFSLGPSTMTIGAGWKQGELAARLFSARPNTGAVMGSCKTVGLSGFALGGGFGFLSRKHGLGVDNIVSLTVVNADGDIVVANDTENKELFWALRGGGTGSFGIVTGMEYRVVPVPPTVTTFFHRFSLDSASEIVPTWFNWIQNMDPNIVSILSMSGGAGSGDLAITGQYLGTPSAFMATKPPTWAGGISMNGWLRERSFPQALDYFNGGASTPRERRWRARSDYYLKPLNQGGIDVVRANLLAKGNPWAFAFLFDSYGPVIRSVPSDAMAFAHRDNILCCMQLYMSWGDTTVGPNPQDDNSVIRLRAIGKALADSGNVSGQAYPNYADATRDDWPTAYYGANLPRLQRAKRAFDPTNFFSHGQSIPLPNI